MNEHTVVVDLYLFVLWMATHRATVTLALANVGLGVRIVVILFVIMKTVGVVHVRAVQQ